MKLEEMLTDKNTLIITPNEKKTKLLHSLSNMDKFFHVKIMTKEEFIEHYYFTYDEKTIAYCFEHYDYSYEIFV